MGGCWGIVFDTSSFGCEDFFCKGRLDRLHINHNMVSKCKAFDKHGYLYITGDRLILLL